MNIETYMLGLVAIALTLLVFALSVLVVALIKSTIKNWKDI